MFDRKKLEKDKAMQDKLRLLGFESSKQLNHTTVDSAMLIVNGK